MFCPECGAEYRSEFKVCADCQVELVEEMPEGISDQGSPSASYDVSDRGPGEDWVIVLEIPDPMMVAAIRSLLEEGGIPFCLARAGGPSDDGSVILGHSGCGGCEPLSVFVPPTEENAALKLLEDFQPAEDGSLPVKLAELPPELAGGEEPLPGELEEEKVYREFTSGEEVEDEEETTDEAAEESEHFCGFCGAKLAPDAREADSGFVTCRSCFRTVRLER